MNVLHFWKQLPSLTTAFAPATALVNKAKKVEWSVQMRAKYIQANTVLWKSKFNLRMSHNDKSVDRFSHILINWPDGIEVSEIKWPWSIDLVTVVQINFV